MPQDTDRKKLGQVIARAWLDKDYHARLLKEPEAVLGEAGIAVKGKVHVHESTEHETHLVLPPRPAQLDEHVRKQAAQPGSCADPALCSAHPQLCSDQCFASPDLCSFS